MSLSFDESIRVIFNKNDDPQRYSIKDVTMNGIDDMTDLFWFLTKILKHGLHHLFAKEDGGVDLDALSQNDFLYVDACMKKIGVSVDLQIVPCEAREDNLHLSKYFDDEANGRDFSLAMSYAVVNNEFEKLENHKLILFTRTKTLLISYAMTTKDEK